MYYIPLVFLRLVSPLVGRILIISVIVLILDFNFRMNFALMSLVRFY